MNFSDANWFDVVASGTASIVIATIEEIAHIDAAGSDVANGTLRLAIRRELSGGSWHAGEVVLVGYAQFVSPLMRAREGGGGWNGVQLDPSNWVVVALPVRTETNAPVLPVAVAALAGPSDPMVEGIERSLAFESTSDPEVRIRLARDGLSGSLPFLVGYLHYAIGRLHRLPRGAAAELEISILTDAARTPFARANAEATLELELFQADSPDDATNQRIVEACLRALPTGDADLAQHLVDALHAMLDGDDASKSAYRARLMAGVTPSDRRAALDTVSRMASGPQARAECKWLAAFLAGGH